jgi:hypothetical protein
MENVVQLIHLLLLSLRKFEVRETFLRFRHRQNVLKKFHFVLFLAHVGVYILCKVWAQNLEEKLRFQVYVD